MSGAVELSTPIGLIRRSEFVPGATIHELIELHDIPVDRQPVVCIKNGAPVLRKDWGIPVTGHDLVQFVAMPQGKSTGGIKGILRLVALIALAVVAPFAAGAIGGALGITSAVGIGLIQAGIMVAGAFLINALLSPKVPGAKGGGDSESSPTYSLTAQGNQARLLQPIPRLYGRHVLFPDFASQPFASYKNNEQYLYQLFCLGVGEYDVEAVRIEETAVWTATGGFTNNFDDVEIEIIPPGQTVTLIPLEIQTSTEVSGQELKNIVKSGSSYTFSGLTATRVSGDDFSNLVPGDVITIAGVGNPNAGTRTVTAVSPGKTVLTVSGANFTSYTGSASFTLDAWVGPYVAVDADDIADKIAVDIIFPQGIGYANDSGGISNSTIAVEVQVRQIDVAGAPIGGFVTVGTHTYTRQTSTPQRVTQEYALTPARYEVRVRRTTEREYGNRYLHLCQWGGLRAHLPDDATYADVTLLAVKMRATDQLTQQSSRKFNTIQTGKVPVWNGTTWSAPIASRSIAWAVADAMRNTVYGGKVPASQIDLEKLLSLDATWTARGDKFDGVFDTKSSLWETISTILRAGRAQPIMVAGVTTFVRDEPRLAARAVFSPRNMVKNSFETTHILYDANAPDDVIVEFMDNRTWKQNEVQCTLPGSLSEAPARIQLFGVTDRAQAWREGMYQAASNAYRRTLARLTSELDGRVLLKGDPVIVSHDVPAWSQSGDVVDRQGLELTLSEPPRFKAGESHYLVLRRPNGREFGPILCTAHVDFDDVVALDATDLAATETATGTTLAQVIDPGLNEERDPPLYIFGVGASDIKRFLLATGTPRGLDQLELAMVNDDPRVYTADAGSPPAEAVPIGPGAVPGAPVATNLNVVRDPNSATNPVKANAAWPAAPGALSYVIQVSYDNVSWDTMYTGTGTSTQLLVQPGLVYFRLAGVNAFRGPWALFSGSFGTASSDPSTPSGLAATASPSAGTIDISWSAAARASTYLVQVFSEASPGVYTVLELSRSTAATALQFTSDDVTAAGGPWGSFQVQVSSVNDSGTSLPAALTVSDYTLSAPTGFSEVVPWVSGNDLQLQWNTVAAASSYDVELYDDQPTPVLLETFNLLGTSLTITAATIAAYPGAPFTGFTAKVRAKNGTLVSDWSTLVIT